MTTEASSGWLLADDGLRCTVAGESVTLKVQSSKVLPSQCDLPGVDWQLREWTQYNLVATVPIRGVRGLPDASPITGANTVWSFQLKNRVGRLVFSVDTEVGSTPPLRAEVLSAKFPTPQQHVSFLNGLVADLAEQTRYADFVPAAGTAFGAEMDPRGPSLLSDLNALLRWSERLTQAVDGVVGDPHRALTELDERMRLSEVRSVTPQLLPQLINAAAGLRQVPAAWPLAAWTRGVAPEWVVVPIAEETLDTPENRFVALALRAASDALERLRATSWIWDEKVLSAEDRRRLSTLTDELEYVLATTFLGELTPGPLPGASQVLARRPAYRSIWDFWQELTAGRRSLLSEIDIAIANRDIATLYELWGFFALSKTLAEQKLGPVERWEDINDERAGVRHGAVARFADDWSLVYNRDQRRPTAYAVTLRPDYLLQHHGKSRIVFDAKFRFEIPSAAEEQYVDDPNDPAMVTMNAVAADIVKMHAYRDALGVMSAVVVFPGNQDRMFTVVPERGARRDEVPIDGLIAGDFEGVGAIHLRPQA